MQSWAIVLLNLIGMGFVITQNRYVLAGGDVGNEMWAVYMVSTLVIGVVVAGAWHLLKKTTKHQTLKHFLMVSWVMAIFSTISTRI